MCSAILWCQQLIYLYILQEIKELRGTLTKLMDDTTETYAEARGQIKYLH